MSMEITKPLPNQVFTEEDSIEIEVRVKQGFRPKTVSFHANGEQIDTVAYTKPYTRILKKMLPKGYNISATGIDNNGNRQVSNTVPVVVAPVRRVAALVSVLLCVLIWASPVLAQSVQLTPGWSTFGQVLPQGYAPASLQVGTLPTQTDVKNRWPDGSIKFAAVSVNATTTGTFPVSPAAASNTTAFVPQWPSASVRFVVEGQTFIAALPAFNSSDCWLSGALVMECRVLVAPVSATGAHPLLQALLDVRSYGTGGHRVDVQVQNVKDVAEAAVVPYDVTVAVAGQTVYQKTGVVQNWQTRWRKTFAVGFPEGTAVQDFSPFYASGIMIPFKSTVTAPARPNVDTAGGMNGQSFDILGFGDYLRPMSQVGSRDEIGPVPAWVAQYLVHKTPALRQYMLRMADLAASFSGAITEPDGQTLISINSYPDYWLDPRATAWPNGPRKTASDPTGTGSPQWRDSFGNPITPDMLEIAHIPSPVFYPYLITADRWYLDEEKLIANFSLLHTTTYDHNRGLPSNGEGRLWSGNELRGAAWGIRGLVETTTILPDVDSGMKMPAGQTLIGYFKPKAVSNLQDMERYANETYSPFGDSVGLLNPLKVMWPYSRPYRYINDANPNAGVYLSVGVWQHAYIAWTSWYAYRVGLITTKFQVKRLATFWSNFMTDAYTLAAVDPAGQPALAYSMPYGIVFGTAPAPYTGPISYWPSHAELTRLNYYYAAPTWQPAPAVIGYYGPEARWFAEMAVQEGVPSGTAALANINAFTFQGLKIADDYNRRAQFAIDFGVAPLPPPPPIDPPIPPTTSTAPTVVKTVSSCTYSLSAMSPDGTTTGWVAQFKRNGSNVGKGDSSAPYTASDTRKPAAFSWSVVWTKSGVSQTSAVTTTTVCQ